MSRASLWHSTMVAKDVQSQDSNEPTMSEEIDDWSDPETGEGALPRRDGWSQRLGIDLVQKAGQGEEALIIDVDGFEGPLDFLLALARQQKLDLTKISMLALSEQYLRFIEQARQLRLELAADYLVMAAWLAYLKSRLLIPEVG